MGKIIEFSHTRFPRHPVPTEEEEQNLTLKLTGLIKEAEAAVAASQKAELSMRKMENYANKSEKIIEKLLENNKELDGSLAKIKESETVTSTSAADVSNSKAQVHADQETVRQSRENIGAIEAIIVLFHGEIKEKRELLDTSIESSKNVIEEFTNKTSKLIEENESLQLQIKEHLQKAVGESLFTAFQKRKEQVAISKWVWSGLTIICSDSDLI